MKDTDIESLLRAAHQKEMEGLWTRFNDAAGHPEVQKAIVLEHLNAERFNQYGRILVEECGDTIYGQRDSALLSCYVRPATIQSGPRQIRFTAFKK